MVEPKINIAVGLIAAGALNGVDPFTRSYVEADMSIAQEIMDTRPREVDFTALRALFFVRALARSVGVGADETNLAQIHNAVDQYIKDLNHRKSVVSKGTSASIE